MNTHQRPDVRSGHHLGLLKRVRALLAAVVEREERPKAASPPPADGRSLDALWARLERLETSVEDLQDALYRQSLRQDESLSELRHRTEPGEIARSLSDDARRRGL
jgi:hypothetical protein